MAITIELWEDTIGGSPASSGSPATPIIRQEVDNLGWKNSPLSENYEWVDYPIIRPPNEFSPSAYSLSYTKYYYYKIYGTYDEASNFSIQLYGDVEGDAPNVEVLYKLTNLYLDPSNDLMTDALIHTTGITSLTPRLSTTDPRNATSFVPVLAANTTYYSEYIVTQVRAYTGNWDEYGNLNPNFELQGLLSEYKTGTPGYDPSLINWIS